jgi:hypothetical protein
MGPKKLRPLKSASDSADTYMQTRLGNYSPPVFPLTATAAFPEYDLSLPLAAPDALQPVVLQRCRGALRYYLHYNLTMYIPIAFTAICGT